MRRPYPSGENAWSVDTCLNTFFIPDPSLTNMSSNGYHHHQLRTNEMIESQNDHLMEEMSSKVKQLRSVSSSLCDMLIALQLAGWSDFMFTIT